MVRVEVYGKPDCPLCDEALDVLRTVRDEIPFELVERDVTRDPAAWEEYAEHVPVVLVDGEEAFRHRVDLEEARRRIERARDAASAAPTARAPRGAKTWLVVAAAVVAAALVGVKGWDALVAAPRRAEQRRADQRVNAEPANVPAPATTVLLADGSPLPLSQLRGQVLFVNFWATWCPPCRDEMPSMLRLGQDLSRAHPGKFRMVAVSVDEGWDEIREFFGGGLPAETLVALDPDMVTTRAFYCAARGACPDSFKFPETYIVDRSGRLVAYLVGPRNWSDPAARRFLEEIIRR